MYPEQAIVNLAKLFSGNEQARVWLQKNNFPELILLHYSLSGYDDAEKKISTQKNFEIVAFIHAIHKEKKAFQWLLENKKAEWAAVANVISGDRKAEEWLKKYNLYHFVSLADAIKDNAAVVQDDDIFKTIGRAIRKVFKPF